MAAAAQETGFESVAMFETAFERYHDFPPAHFARRIRQIDEWRPAEVKEYWAEESPPPDWRPIPVAERALRALCAGLCPGFEGRDVKPGLALLADLLHPVIVGRDESRRDAAKGLLFKLLKKQTVKQLARKFFGTYGHDPVEDMASDAFVQALSAYFKRPERFDPMRCSLPGYLEPGANC